MASVGLTTLVSVERWLGLQSGNADEALLTELIDQVSTFLENECDRQFALQSYTEVHDGNSNNKMPFTNRPVVSVTSVTIDGQVIPPGNATSTPGFFFDTNRLMLNGYRFRRGLGNVTTILQAGFVTVPSDLARAANETIGLAYREIKRIGLSSQSAGDGSTTSYIVKDLPPRAASILDNYRRVAPT